MSCLQPSAPSRPRNVVHNQVLRPSEVERNLLLLPMKLNHTVDARPTSLESSVHLDNKAWMGRCLLLCTREASRSWEPRIHAGVGRPLLPRPMALMPPIMVVGYVVHGQEKHQRNPLGPNPLSSLGNRSVSGGGSDSGTR